MVNIFITGVVNTFPKEYIPYHKCNTRAINSPLFTNKINLTKVIGLNYQMHRLEDVHISTTTSTVCGGQISPFQIRKMCNVLFFYLFKYQQSQSYVLRPVFEDHRC